MSGYPNPKDITELRATLQALKVEDAEVAKATTDRINAQTRLEEAKERVQMYQDKAKRLMDAMDVLAPGNTGYHNRLMALLTGLAEK